MKVSELEGTAVTLALPYWPGAHGVQRMPAVVSVECWPFGHASHDGTLVVRENCPAAHELQALEIGILPGVQVVQPAAPAVEVPGVCAGIVVPSVYLPADGLAHESHRPAVCPGLEYLPAAQGTQAS